MAPESMLLVAVAALGGCVAVLWQWISRSFARLERENAARETRLQQAETERVQHIRAYAETWQRYADLHAKVIEKNSVVMHQVISALSRLTCVAREYRVCPTDEDTAELDELSAQPSPRCKVS